MTELTPELHHALVDACDQYGYHNQVAAACDVAWSTVRAWLIKGLTSNAPEDEKYRDFRREYYHRDSELGKRTYKRLMLADKARGERKVHHPQIKATWEWFHKRWPVLDSEASILPLIEAKETKRKSLVESLRNPNPELAEMIRQAGLVPADPDAGLRDHTH